MSQYKEDIAEAKERLGAWWDHELIDRPIISYWAAQPDVKLYELGNLLDYFDPFYLAEHWEGIDEALDEFERVSKLMLFAEEAIPRFNPYYGPGIMASVFGIVPQYKSRTVWFQRDTDLKDLLPILEGTKLNANNEWFDRLVRITEIASQRGNGDYCIAMTDLGGILDVISSFLGPTKLILTMRRNPDLIHACRQVILEKWMMVYERLQSIIEKYSFGCNSWLNLWWAKRWYPIQCDFSAFLSPRWFKEFVVDDIKAQAERFDYAIYHLDGPDALVHLDELLKIDALDGIQWVPGAGNELKSSETWMPVYKKIQNAGKSVIIDYFEQPERLPHFYNNLDPKYLFISTVFTDYFRAKFSVPEFAGGNAGEGSFRSFKKELRKKMKSKK